MVFNFIYRSRFSCQNICDRTQRRLHNASRSAEYDARSGSVSDGAVKIRVLKTCKINSCFPDHLRQLARSKNSIHIGISGSAQLRPVSLEFLRRTGHYRYHINLGRIDVLLLRVISFEYRAEHLVRRFAGRKIFQEIRIIMLAEFNPSRAARRNHRELASIFDSLQKLRALFHNCEIRARIRIEHFVRSESADRGHHFACRTGTDRHSKGLSDRDAHCRRSLENYIFFRIGNCVPDLFNFTLLLQRSRRADGDALAAVYAGRFHKRFAERTADHCFKAALHRINDADRLNVLADADASPA